MRGLFRLVVATVGYIALAIALTWPLALQTDRSLPGDPAGDTGVYVWNFWVVAHQLQAGQSPLRTERIFAATGAADLSQHNTTLAPAMLASPLVGRLGAVRAFNIVYLLLLAGCGLGVYLLAEYKTGKPLESFVAGALTAASPCVLARSTEHLSLLAIGIVPVFVWTWVRMLDRVPGRLIASLPAALAAGVAMATAAYCDPYLAVYCALLAALMAAARFVDVSYTRRPFFAFGGRYRQILDGLLVILALVATSIVISGGWSTTVVGIPIVARTLYTPLLAITLLIALRLTWWLRPRIALGERTIVWRFIDLAATSVLAAVACLSPWAVALAQRARTGTFVEPAVYWRSSPAGVDLAAFVAPSPMHPVWGEAVRTWLDRLHPAGFAEYTPSLSLTALCLVAAALLLRLRLPRRWLVATGLCAACALGPFVHVFGVNTFVPGPWAILRYVPVIAWARSPSRFALVAAIGVGVLAAHALVALRAHLGARSARLLMACVVVAAVVEAWPQPRTLFAATPPAIFAAIAADPDASATVLELPVGIRDGTSSLGDFSARTQFHQTFHGKRVIGGYLSRVSQHRRDLTRDMPMYFALLALSEGRSIDDAQRARASARRDGFVRRTGLRYVVIDARRCSGTLRKFAVTTLGLEPVGQDGGYELYRVLPPPPEAPSARLEDGAPGRY